MHKRLLLVLCFLALVIAAVGAAPATASHSWSNYHWARTSNPFTLQLGDNASGNWDTYLGQVSIDWTASSVLDTTIVAGGTNPRPCKATTGRVEVCNATYGFNGWLGLATIWISGSHIVKATSKVNDSYFNTSTYNDPNAKRHVLCQEVGHVFGLGHQTAVSCMDDQNGLFDPAYVSPNAHDYQQLETIYNSHTDSSSTVASVAATAFAEETGRLDRISDSLFVEDQGNGRKIYKWVFWAIPGAVR